MTHPTVSVTTSSLLLLVLFSGAASAQGLLERGTAWRWPGAERPAAAVRAAQPLSPLERRYADAFASALGSKALRAERIQQQVRIAPDVSVIGAGPADETSAPSRGATIPARGVRVTLTDGTVVERLRFPDDQAAFDYTLFGVDLGSEDALVEARGGQVVVIRGAKLEDPARAAQALEAAWGTIRAAEGAPSVSAVVAKDGGMMLTYRGENEVLEREFQRAVNATQRRIDQGVPSFRHEDGTWSFGEGEGLNGKLSTEGGAHQVVVAHGQDQRARLEQQLQRALRERGRRSRHGRAVPSVTQQENDLAVRRGEADRLRQLIEARQGPR
ncbi:MAG: hypothetical protein AB7N76_29770 [Planctomycetota bacterium]